MVAVCPIGLNRRIGIVGLIVGSCFPVAWYGFTPIYSVTRVLYLTAICSTGGLVIFGSLTGALNRWSDVTRLGIFVALALSGFSRCYTRSWCTSSRSGRPLCCAALF